MMFGDFMLVIQDLIPGVIHCQKCDNEYRSSSQGLRRYYGYLQLDDLNLT
jgi:hypothetical protein